MKRVTIDNKNIDSSIIKEAIDTISSGGIVAIPTETVYGLAVSIQKPQSLERLFGIKQRPQNMPLTVALGNREKAYEYFSVLPPFGYRIIEKFWPGPLTIIYFDNNNGKVGIRIPSDPIASKVLSGLGSGAYLTSANISGKPDAFSGSEVESIFDGNLDLIVDSGNTLYRQASTVLDLTLNPFKVLREGVIKEREIVDVFIKKRIIFVCTGNSCRSPMAQFLMEKYITQEKPYLKGRHEILSYGISTLPGLPVSPYTVDVLREKEGMNVSGYTSKKITRDVILSSDLIFTMADTHTNYILNLEPTAEGRVFGLKKFLPKKFERDIPDPIGKDMATYEEVYSIIKEAILELTEWL